MKDEAVRWSIKVSKARNADADSDEIQRIIDEAVSEVERRPKRKADKA